MEDFDSIYKKYYKQVYFYLLELSGNKDVAEEITQESFFRVLNKIDTFNEQSSLYTWIIQIAKNTFYSHCRSAKQEQAELDENIASGDDIEAAAEDKKISLDIHALLHRLNEPYKEVFWMRTFGELSFREIGRLHGKTESWARVTYHRARLMIREGLDYEV